MANFKYNFKNFKYLRQISKGVDSASQTPRRRAKLICVSVALLGSALATSLALPLVAFVEVEVEASSAVEEEAIWQRAIGAQDGWARGFRAQSIGMYNVLVLV